MGYICVMAFEKQSDVVSTNDIGLFYNTKKTFKQIHTLRYTIEKPIE